MSESLHSGYLPLWNPYINYGFPQYGDMSAGYWSPITWLIAATVGYNAYSFTIEILLYILIGGLGMYKLTSHWKLATPIRIIAGISFMCCGYNIGHLQHVNWLSGAAFLPWCFWGYLAMLNNASLKNILVAALLFYMLVASAHPGIIFSAFYFFLVVGIISILYKNRNTRTRESIKKFILSHLIFLFAFTLVAAGLIVGYADILPYFSRGDKIDLQSSLLFPTTIQSWLSLLIPMSTVKNQALFATDVSMRNCYIGLTPLIFLIVGSISKKTKWQWFLLIAGLLFGLLSLGSIFKTFAYNNIPFIGYVRLNGEFRIFAMLCFIVFASIELNKFWLNKNISKTKWVIKSLQLLLLLAICFGAYFSFIEKNSFVFNIRNIGLVPGVSSKLKLLIDSVTFYDTLWIQGIIQLVFLYFIRKALSLGNYTFLKNIIIVEMILSCLVNIPYTGAGKTSVAQLQSTLNKSPKGIVVPALHPIVLNDTLGFSEKDLLGNWSMYSKQIGNKTEVAYPIILKNMQQYFDDENAVIKYTEKPFMFLQHENKNSNFTITKFTGSEAYVDITTDTANKLIIQQNWYPHWRYNGDQMLLKEGPSFMSIPIKSGHQLLKIEFKTGKIKTMMLISLFFFLLFITLIFFSNKKTTPFYPSSLPQ